MDIVVDKDTFSIPARQVTNEVSKRKLVHGSVRQGDSVLESGSRHELLGEKLGLYRIVVDHG